MHTCSRPCNNDIDRRHYLNDVHDAIAFTEGHDEEMEHSFVEAMNALATEMKFEEAEVVHRRLDKLQRARKDYKDKFFSIWKFDFIVVLAADSVSRCKIAFVRQGRIVWFEMYEVDQLAEQLRADLQKTFGEPIERDSDDTTYDEFCLVANFIVDPLQSVDLLPVKETETLPEKVLERLRQRKRKRKPIESDQVSADLTDVH
jgi:excinuclease UvrABC nuclease subunit